LRETHFQRDLQTDNIDADIVIEELQAVRAERTALTYVEIDGVDSLTSTHFRSTQKSSHFGVILPGAVG